MSKITALLATIALVLVVAALPSAASARGNGGPASAHHGCNSNNGIPLDDGQSVIVDGETISCNNGTVCHSKKGQIPYCYYNAQPLAMQPVTPTPTPPVSAAPPKAMAAKSL